jgi:hypothetical protein
MYPYSYSVAFCKAISYQPFNEFQILVARTRKGLLLLIASSPQGSGGKSQMIDILEVMSQM